MFCAISSFVTLFSKKPSAAEASESVYMRERVKKKKIVGSIFLIWRKCWRKIIF